MKKSVLFLILLAFSVGAGAVPAKRVQRTLTLADGTQVSVTLSGDEYAHYWKADDGRAFTLNGEDEPVEIDESVAQEQQRSRMQASNLRRQTRSAQRRSAWGAEKNPIYGERKGLVILVEFSDLEFRHTTADYEEYFNSPGYSRNNCSGSVRDYFLSQSYGQFALDFDVMGPVTLSKSYSYYGENAVNGDDLHAGEMVAEAVQMVAPALDLNRYDWDGDGYVDQVFVVYAGYGEHAGASKNTVWPHEYELSAAASQMGDGPGALTFNGVTVDTYACSCELRGTSGSTMDGIGTACHEFSHCLFLPDMYDTSGSAFGMDVWDLMDYGSYNGKTGNGETPAPFTSYERMYCGWLTPIELTDPCEVKDMPAITDAPVAYMIRNSNGSYPGEYYLLENHQQEGWDAYAPAHGMLVLHVDFNSLAWIENTVNSVASHQRMTIIPADNRLTHLNVSGDTWPGTSSNTELTDTSTPAAKLYNPNANGQKYLSHPITEITEENGLIGFLFDGGFIVGTPVLALQTGSVGAQGFQVVWTSVPDATDYELKLVRLNAEGVQEASYAYYTTSTSYVFNQLQSGCRYSVTVRARLDGIPGGWSESVMADLPAAILAPGEKGGGDGLLYDLQGRPVGQPRRGLYIRNGHKYIVR
ncbi:MAG: M6 family metalloprotease domain-containing protein [Bacteroidaceae bacterium]